MPNPVFITARFRSGSTLLWNIFRKVQGVTAYYEPLHEQLPSLIKNNIPAQPHHFYVDSYIKEYLNLPDLHTFHKPEFGLVDLYLDETDEAGDLEKYLRYLISAVPHGNTPVFQFNRVDFRLAWLKRVFPEATIIHLYRSPRAQWISTIRDTPFDVDNDLDADPYRITTWARDLIRVFPFLASPNIRHVYQRYYYLWRLSLWTGERLASYSVSYEEIIQNPKVSIKNIMEMAKLKVSDSNIDICESVVVKPPVNSAEQYKANDWFDELETECDDLLREFFFDKKITSIPLQEISKENRVFPFALMYKEAAAWAFQNAQLTILKNWNYLDEKEAILQGLKHNLEEQTRLLEENNEALLQKERDIKQKDIILEKRDQLLNENDRLIREKDQIIQAYYFSFRYWLLHSPLYYKVLTRWISVFKHLFTPRVGTIEQYPPKKIEIPSFYYQKDKTKDNWQFPRISIVTPSFNQANFLPETIRSVIEQDYPNLEYVVKDGQSNDGTKKVLKQFSAQLHHVESSADDGQANAINLGFQHTNGEIMAFLNSDDILLPGTLYYVANYFLSHPNVDVVYGHRVILDENGQEIGRWILPPHNDKIILWADYIPQETLFWRRAIWEKAGGKMDEAFHFALDWDLILRFRKAGANFKRLPRFLAAFRFHSQQKTSMQIDSVGLNEMNLLRERIQGREIREEEIALNIKSYLRVSVLYHKLYRLGLLRY